MKLNKKGFSLIELLVALSILAIGLLGIIPLAITTIRLNTYQNQMLNAKYLAERQAEFLRSITFTAPELANDNDNNDLYDTANPDHILATTIEGITYNVMWNIVDDSAGTRTINIIVQWVTPRTGETKNYNITLVRSSYEI
ncbi:MAG: type IV pilus modification PilV family protein [Candidatus Hydrothermia bacterium]